ncbi:hypothetical protein THIOKS13210006 [Thiocapsa sp. KS1]|nr:hypothetical protein THIOKS13210006 [Thiocapsa sp. KS1]
MHYAKSMYTTQGYSLKIAARSAACFSVRALRLQECLARCEQHCRRPAPACSTNKPARCCHPPRPGDGLPCAKPSD